MTAFGEPGASATGSTIRRTSPNAAGRIGSPHESPRGASLDSTRRLVSRSRSWRPSAVQARLQEGPGHGFGKRERHASAGHAEEHPAAGRLGGRRMKYAIVSERAKKNYA